MRQTSIHKIKARDKVEGRGVGSALVKKLVERGGARLRFARSKGLRSA